MGYRGRLTLPALTLCLLAAGAGSALAQAPLRQPERITDIAPPSAPARSSARSTTRPAIRIEGVVVSALGSTNAFAVSDKLGQFSLRQLPPGPYLVRAHREGYLTVRGTIRRSPPRRPDAVVADHAPRRASRRPPGSPKPAWARRPSAPNRSRRRDGRAERNRPGLAPAPDEAQRPARHRHRWRLCRPRRFLVHRSVRVSGPRRGARPPGPRGPCSRTSRWTARSTCSRPARSTVRPNCSRWIARAAWRSSRSARTSAITALGRAGRDEPGRPRFVDRRRQLRLARRACRTSYEVGHVLQPAALSGRQHRGAGGAGRHGEQRRLGVRLRRVGRVADDLTVGYGANYAHYDYLVDPSLLSPRVNASYMVGRALAGARPGVAAAERAGRAGVPAADAGVMAAAAAHVLAAVAGRLPHAGPRALRSAAWIACSMAPPSACAPSASRSTTRWSRCSACAVPKGPAAALGHYYVGTAGDANMMASVRPCTHALSWQRPGFGGVFVLECPMDQRPAAGGRACAGSASCPPAVLPASASAFTT